MRLSRSVGNEMVRFLRSVRQPLYLLDEQRRIVFFNEACGNLLGVAAMDLIGRTAKYQSSGEDPTGIVANGLCPPPEAFRGQRLAAVISVPSGDPLQQHRVEFIPLVGSDPQSFHVLALVEPLPFSAAEREIGSHTIDRFDETQQLHDLIQRFRREMAHAYHLDRLAGQSAAMLRVRAQVKMAATTSATVLIVGPAGIGREHVARTIHASQSQNGGAFIPIFCSTLPAESLRSALTSQLSRPKHIETATATLFLSDVDSMPSEIQSELTQILTTRLGNLRIVCSATQPPDVWISAGGFRSDLAHRLSTLVIELPPLARRSEDIPIIAQMMLEDLNGQGEKQLRGFAPEAIDRLMQYDWPGQINELASAVREAFLQAEGVEVAPANLPKRLQQAAEAARFARKPIEHIDLEQFLAQVETELIRRALRAAKENKSEAARLLGLNRPKLYRRMVQLGLERDDERPPAE